MLSKTKFKPRIVVPAAVALLALPCLLIYHEIRHQRLNHELIVAISRQKFDRAIELLREGADGAAREDSGQPVTIRTVLRQFLDHFRHNARARPEPPDSRRPALLLFYETARGTENTYASDGEAPPLPERLPLLLLQSGAPAEESDSSGTTAVYFAAHFHHHKVLRILAERGADVNAYNVESTSSPLKEADAVDTEVLLAHHADPEAKDSSGNTALFDAGVRKTELLLSHGAIIEAVNNRLESPLVSACSNGNDAVALCLLAHGASIKQRDILGGDPFLKAAGSCRLETLLALVKAGADVKTKDKNGTNALMLSLENPDQRVFEWLAIQHFDANAQGIDGITAMTIAAQKVRESRDYGVTNKRFIQVMARLNAMGAKPPQKDVFWYGEEGD